MRCGTLGTGRCQRHQLHWRLRPWALLLGGFHHRPSQPVPCWSVWLKRWPRYSLVHWALRGGALGAGRRHDVGVLGPVRGWLLLSGGLHAGRCKCLPSWPVWQRVRACHRGVQWALCAGHVVELDGHHVAGVHPVRSRQLLLHCPCAGRVPCWLVLPRESRTADHLSRWLLLFRGRCHPAVVSRRLLCGPSGSPRRGVQRALRGGALRGLPGSKDLRLRRTVCERLLLRGGLHECDGSGLSQRHHDAGRHGHQARRLQGRSPG